MITRRRVLALLLAGLAATAVGAQEAPPLQGKSTLVYIGTHTSDKGKGIYLFRLQSAGTEVFQNVTLVPLGLAAETANPTFFEIDAARRLLFAVNEVDQFEGKPGGAVSAFAIDDTGRLKLLNQRASMGTAPCHLAIASEGKHLVVANCGDGSLAVLPVAADGQLGAATDIIKGVKAACVNTDPAGKFVFAVRAIQRQSARVSNRCRERQAAAARAHFSQVRGSATADRIPPRCAIRIRLESEELHHHNLCVRRGHRRVERHRKRVDGARGL